MKDSSVRRWSSFHQRLFRVTKGRMGKRLVDNDMLVLTTTGRVSGKPHAVPLLYLREGDSLVLIASYGGRPDHPDWYLNLVAEPEITVQTPSGKFDSRARTASEDERALLWPKIVAAYDGYEVYQGRTDRQIPVVILESIGT